MNIMLIEDALALIEEGSMRGAAQRRNVTQPAFSRRIATLENWLGVKLVERLANKVEIKDTLLNRQDEFRSLLKKMDSLRGEYTSSVNSLKIGTQHTLASSVFPEIYNQISKYEFIDKIRLRTRNQDEIISQFLKYEIDLAITYHTKNTPMPPFNDSVLQKIWRRDSLAPVIGGDLRFSLNEKQELPINTAILCYPPDSEFGKILEASGAYEELANDNPRPLETGFAAGMCELIKLGTGIGWVPQSLARDDIQRGDLLVLSQSYGRIPLDVVLTSHEQNRIGKNVIKRLINDAV